MPASSPQFNRLARVWKFVKQPGLDAKSSPDSASFHQALLTGIEPAPPTHNAALERLLTRRVPTCQKVPVIGEQQRGAQTPTKKVLSKAA